MLIKYSLQRWLQRRAGSGRGAKKGVRDDIEAIAGRMRGGGSQKGSRATHAYVHLTRDE